ncbi:MAG: hypothetical protein ABIP79_00625 [Chitinophagaceae bacterium]
MVKLLLLILTFGFVLQSTGINPFIKKPMEQTEQMPDDTLKGEEKGKEDYKKEQDNISGFEYFQIGLMPSLHDQFENIQLYSSGVYANPFLPPRYLS